MTKKNAAPKQARGAKAKDINARPFTEYYVARLGNAYIHELDQADADSKVKTVKFTSDFDCAMRVLHISHIDEVDQVVLGMDLPKLNWQLVTVNVTDL